jgi:hypothetical protein
MILSISGKKAVGKSTIAGMFVSKYNFTELTFAQPLKRAISVAFSIPLSDLEDQDRKEQEFEPRIVSESEMNEFLDILTPYQVLSSDDRRRCHMVRVEYNSYRQLMQKMGTDVIRRQVKDSYWIDIMRDRITSSQAKDIVVTDARFPNERKLLKELKGKLMLVKREVQKNDGHVSENMLGLESDYDVIVNNDGSVIGTLYEVDLWYNMNCHQ